MLFCEPMTFAREMRYLSPQGELIGVAYIDLLRATQQLRVVQESNENTEVLAKLTADFAATGQGLQADADRMQTEARLGLRIASCSDTKDTFRASNS